MRERITFVHGAHDAFNSEQLIVDQKAVQVRRLKAAREDRLTIGFSELPQELYRVLKQCHELHIRWVSRASYAATVPFVSRASPGLHVFFTPQKNRKPDLLCPQLKKVFGDHLKCSNPDETFTGHSLVSGRFAASAAQQYHASLPSLKDFETYIVQKICPTSNSACNSRAAYLRQAAYLDVDYDAISQSLVLTAFYASSETPGGWDERISKVDAAAKLEVGILAPETPRQPEELSLGGFLVNVGEDTKAKPTLFSFPSRHHPLLRNQNSTYTTSFAFPTGLHPTLRLRFPSTLFPPLPSCALHTYITLPSYIFPDKYQLASANLLASKNLHAIRSLAGETDLEAPDWVIQKWGSSMLMELAPPTRSERSDSTPWSADIPLHLRYLTPNEGGQRDIEVPWPVVFWACPADEGTKMNTNPFDRLSLGYEGLFGPRTMFYHLTPQVARERGRLIEGLQVPVLDVNQVKYVEIGTMIAIFLGTLWLVAKLIRIFSYEPQWLVGKRIGQFEAKAKRA